jgi:rod shape-determining protein MreC
MQQIFNYIFKNSNKLLFLLLLAFSLTMIVKSHCYQRSKLISSANFVSGGVYQRLNSVDEYFSLRVTNEILAKENAKLKLLLMSQIDTSKPVPLDMKGVSNANIIPSKVIHNSYSVQQNYITINSGDAAGVKENMGVINENGIVGLIENTSKNYATIQSILNTTSRINAKIKKLDHIGTLQWNGKNAGLVQLYDIPRLALIHKGDTIVTGGKSEIFPDNLNIGTIDKIYKDNETNYWTIDVKLFNDMTNLGFVYILKTKDYEEIKALEAKKDENE